MYQTIRKSVPNNKKVSKTLNMNVLRNKIKNDVCVCLDLLVAIENWIFIGLWASIYIFLSEKNIQAQQLYKLTYVHTVLIIYWIFLYHSNSLKTGIPMKLHKAVNFIVVVYSQKLWFLFFQLKLSVLKKIKGYIESIAPRRGICCLKQDINTPASLFPFFSPPPFSTQPKDSLRF